MIGTAGVDTTEALALRADMVADLIREGLLDDERWRRVFLAVPRHIFVPASYEGETRIEGEDRREQWLRPVYSDTALVTRGRHGVPTSSGTRPPSLITRMLHALQVEDGDRVLQLGTGTGYTAALVCERLGSGNVTSIDVEPELTEAARERLRRCGYHPTVITGDGNLGHPAGYPYDRCLVTFPVTKVALTWIDHTRIGGVIVAPVCSSLAHLTVTGSGQAIGTFIEPGHFIRHRAPASSALVAGPVPLAAHPRWTARSTDLPAGIVDDKDFSFILAVTRPHIVSSPVNGDPHNLRVIAPDGSHAHISPDGHLTQIGPHRVWDDVELIHRLWRSLGAPVRERFGLTVSGNRQHIWLDEPNSDHQWEL